MNSASLMTLMALVLNAPNADVTEHIYFEEQAVVVTKTSTDDLGAGEIVAYYPRSRLFFLRNNLERNQKAMFVLDPKRKEAGVSENASYIDDVTFEKDYYGNIEWKILTNSILSLLREKERVSLPTNVAAFETSKISYYGKQYDKLENARSGSDVRRKAKKAHYYYLAREKRSTDGDKTSYRFVPARESYRVDVGPADEMRTWVQKLLYGSKFQKSLPEQAKPTEQNKNSIMTVHSSGWNLFTSHYYLFPVEVKVQRVGPNAVGEVENVSGDGLFLTLHRRQRGKSGRIVGLSSGGGENPKGGFKQNSFEPFDVQSIDVRTRDEFITEIRDVVVPTSGFLNSILAPFLDLDKDVLVCESGICKESNFHVGVEKEKNEGVSFFVRSKKPIGIWKVWMKVSYRRAEPNMDLENSVSLSESVSDTVRNVPGLLR